MDSRLRKSRQQEKDTARRLGGRRRAASGALPLWKGDVSSELFLVECKRTDKGQIVIKLADWNKIFQEAAREGKSPLMAIQIGTQNLYLVPDYTLETLLEESTDGKKKR